MKQRKLQTKISAFLLAVMMVLSGFPQIGSIVHAAGPNDAVYSQITDTSTYTMWEDVLGEEVGSTENSGRIWTDKTVFDGSQPIQLQPSGITIQPSSPDNFLVNLSALSSNKEIAGESAIPVDVVFVLDMSTSMSDNDRVDEMVSALNDAMSTLLTDERLHKGNRVGVVTYNRYDAELLPLDHYSLGGNATQYVTASRSSGRGNENRITVGADVQTSEGEPAGRKQIDTSGYTVIQEGIEAGSKMLINSADKDVDGIKRIPILIVMSDGVVSNSYENYMDLSGSFYADTGRGESLEEPITAFLTHLTGEYYKNEIENAYQRDSFVYTLGLAVGEDGQAVLDPSGTTSENSHYNDLIALLNNFLETNVDEEYHSEGNRNNRTSFRRHEDTVTTNQFNDAYFAAADGNLSDAFDDIVNEIIIQSRYYPTDNDAGRQNLSGYISFEDEIGRFMEVKKINGLVSENMYMTGAKFAQMVTRMDPDNPTPEAFEFVISVADRLGIENAQAMALIDDAYKDGQLYYNNDNGFGNYMAWYADADGQYLGFAKKDKSNLSDHPQAVYFNRSYVVIGDSNSGYAPSDYMYVTIRVGERLQAQDDESAGTQKVIFKVPSALVPIIKYEASITGDDLDSANNGRITRTMNYPIRMFYEVGVREDINEFNVADVVNGADPEYIHKGDNTAEGKYDFYSNAWYETSPKARTLVTYTPSEQNEYYVFDKNTTIYTDEDCTQELTSEPRKGGHYYYKKAVFEFDESIGSGIETDAQITHTFGKIRDDALFDPETQAENFAYDSESQTWYMKLGTPKVGEAQAGIEVYKGQNGNKTGTSEYVRATQISNIPDEPLILVQNRLGNNGRLTLQQQQGIMIEKKFDEAHPNTGDATQFTFKITLDDTSVNRAYPMAIFTGGVREDETINFTNGVATVTLSEDDKVYITGLDTGIQYTVTEEPVSDPDYLLKTVETDGGATFASSTGAVTGTIADYEIGEMTFVNQYVETTEITVEKQLEGDSYDIGNYQFKAVVDDEERSFPLPANGKNTLRVPVGVQVSVTETNVPNYATTITAVDADGDSIGTVNNDSKTWSAPADGITEPVTITFTNTWDTEPLIYDIDTDITVLKNLTGREFNDTDNFSFVIKDAQGTVVSDGSLGEKTAEDVADDSKGQKQVDFESLTFTEPGTYVYTVSEIRPMDGALPGISYDENAYELEIVVGLTDGELTITSKMLDGAVIADDTTMEFNNTYTPDSVSPVLQVRKVIENPIEAVVSYNDFAFTATQTSSGTETGNPINGVIDVSGTVKFTVPAITQEGTYTYVIKETANPDNQVVTYDSKVITATVVIDLVDNSELRTTSVTYSVNGVPVTDPVFTNKVSADPASVSVSGTKLLDGRNIKDSDNFTFKAYPSNAEGMITGTGEPVAFTLSSEAGKENEGNLTWQKSFDKVGTYYYVIAEDKGTVQGITYDPTRYLIKVDVTHENLSATALTAAAAVVKKTNANGVFEGVTGDTAVAFTNTFAPEETTADIRFGKQITSDSDVEGLNRQWQEGDSFTFLLRETDKDFENAQYRMSTTLTYENQTGSFTVPIPAEGTYYYQLTESQRNVLPGFTNDAASYHITITAAVDETTGELKTTTSIQKADGTAVNSILFDNFYTAQPTNVTLQARKVFTNNTNIVKRITDFEFELLDGNKDRIGEVVHPDANGNVTFSVSGLDKVDTYTYYIREIAKSDGILYDSAEHKVTVSVADNGKGSLVPSVAYGTDNNGSPVFHNTLEIPEESYAKVQFHAQKELSGKELAAGEFKFQMTETNAAGVPVEGKEVFEAENDAEGNIVFDELTFDGLLHTYYVIEEIVPENAEAGQPWENGIIYDFTKYLIEVNVTNPTENGVVNLSKLTADTKITILGSDNEEEEILFSNAYLPEGTIVDTDAEGGLFAKVVEGRDWLDSDAFAFTLKELNEAPLPDGETEAVVVSGGTEEGKQVKFGFGKIAFTHEDLKDAVVENGVRKKTFTYEVTENGYEISDMSPKDPDQAAVLEITVTDDGSGRLQAEVKCTDFVFTNVYEKPQEPPKPTEPSEPDKETDVPQTGDNTNVGLWIALLLVSAGGLLIVLYKTKRDNRKAEQHK